MLRIDALLLIIRESNSELLLSRSSLPSFCSVLSRHCFFGTRGEHWLLWIVFKPPPPPSPFPALSSISNSFSTVGAAFLGSFVVALFLFLALSTSSPCARSLRTLVRVRGEALEHLSFISLNVTPPLDAQECDQDRVGDIP